MTERIFRIFLFGLGAAAFLAYLGWLAQPAWEVERRWVDHWTGGYSPGPGITALDGGEPVVLVAHEDAPTTAELISRITAMEPIDETERGER